MQLKLASAQESGGTPLLTLDKAALKAYFSNPNFEKLLKLFQFMAKDERLGALAVRGVCHFCSLHPQNKNQCAPLADGNRITMVKPVTR